MKFCLFLGLAGVASASPIALLHIREVPQEHSHEQFLRYFPTLTFLRNRTTATFLRVNNPFKIVDPVFGLLGNAAAVGGAGTVADPDCLQQQTADSMILFLQFE